MSLSSTNSLTALGEDFNQVFLSQLVVFYLCPFSLFLPRDLKKNQTAKVKIKVQMSQESSTFPLPAASPAEIENSCRISLGNGKDYKKHVIGGEEPLGSLTARDFSPPAKVTSHQHGEDTRGDISLQTSAEKTLRNCWQQ